MPLLRDEENYLKSLGYKYLGAGSFQMAFKEPGTGYCYKVAEKDKGFNAFLTATQKIKSIHLPKVYEVNEFRFPDRRSIKMVQYRTEFLHKDKDIGLASRIIDQIRNYLKYGYQNEYIETLISRDFNRKDLRAVSRLFKIGDMANLIRDLLKFSKRRDVFIDIHDGNFMVRKVDNKKQIVFIDPFASEW